MKSSEYIIRRADLFSHFILKIYYKFVLEIFHGRTRDTWKAGFQGGCTINSSLYRPTYWKSSFRTSSLSLYTASTRPGGGGSSHNIGNTDLPPTRKEDRKVTVHIYNLISRRFFNIFFFSTQTTTVKNKVISKKGWQVIRRLLLRIGRFYGFFFF